MRFKDWTRLRLPGHRDRGRGGKVLFASVLLSDNINEYVTALLPVLDEIHVVDNAQRVPVLSAPHVKPIAPSQIDHDDSLESYVAQNRIQVIYAQGRKSLCRYSRPARRANHAIKVITTCHNGHVWQSTLKSMAFIASVRWLGDGIVFLAKRHYDQWRWFCRLIGLPVWYLPNPVDLDRFLVRKRIRPLKPSRVVLGTVGGILGPKGQAVALQALNILVQRNYDVSYKFVGAIGDREYKQKLDEMIRTMRLESRVEWLGEMKYEDIPGFLQTIDVLVCPSFCEVMPFCILEAMASGLPIVASDVGGIPDLVLNDVNGFVVKAGHARSMADAIRRIMDENSFERLGEQSRNLAETRFACRIIGPRLRDILLKVAE